MALKVLSNSKHIEAAEIIRQLEFAFTQLELSIDELMFALQYVQLGKIPLNLISPNMLRDMLQNVSVLPRGYDLIVSLRTNNVFMHYEMIQAVMLADLHSLKLVMIVPLKTMNVQFTFTGWLCYQYVSLTILLFNLRLRKIILGLIFYKDT
jgi:hypothetical protein